MLGESKRDRPFTRRVKTLAGKLRRKPVQTTTWPISVVPPATGTGGTSVTVTVTKPAPKPKPKPTQARVRSEMRSIMRLLVDHEPKVHYAQVRPMKTRLIRTVPQLKKQLASKAGVTMDCSESTTLIARLGGAKDPNGCGYDGTGYTGTILTACHPIAKKQALPGDAVVFGAGDGNHVCLVYEAGTDPLLFSHGQERGPILVRHSVESRYQTGPARFVRFV